MESENLIEKYTFTKEKSGKWYVNLPEWQGPRGDLEMVDGADRMLDHLGKGQESVSLLMSEQNFPDSSILTLIEDLSTQTGGGGIYLLETYQGELLNQRMWLCDVTEWVFGKLPKKIYLKVVDKEPDGTVIT